MTKHAELFSCRGMTLRNTVVWALPVLVALWAPSRAEGSTPVVLSRLGDRVRVEVGGTLFTEYIFSGATRPYCYPVLAADGTSLVRDFPMKTTAGEDQDHPHHRALMFAHADVNKIDFWNEGTSGTAYPKGQIVHDAILEMKSGEVGVLRTKNSWRAPAGEVVATDNRTLRFQEKNGVRLLDFDVTLEARPDKPLTLGDNKDGTMAIRIAQWMTMPHRIRKQMVAGVGHIETARGDRDADAWGKRAPWCVYYAEYRGTTYGVALFDHPANLSHPTWWMARDYGLFAANPFGKRDFEKEQNHPAGIGDRTLAPGASLTLRYRFIFFQGRPESVGFERLFQQYSSAHP